MIASDVRAFLVGQLNVDISSDLIHDNNLMMVAELVVETWFRYRRSTPTTTTVTTVNQAYQFPQPYPERIVNVFTLPGPCSVKYQYSAGLLYIFQNDGDYFVQYSSKPTASSVTIQSMPFAFQTMLLNRLKMALGQKIKFAKFGEQPFELDGEALYQEGSEGWDRDLEWCQVNHDPHYH